EAPPRPPDTAQAISDWLASHAPPLPDTPANRDKARAALAKRVTEIRQAGTPTELTPEAEELAAQMYVRTGQLPPFGLGTAAAKLRSRVLSRAAQILKESGEGLESQATRVAMYRASSAELTRLQGQ